MAFDKYSRYYDLFYREKDYKSEVRFVKETIEEYLPKAKSILDFGCGTGAHAVCLAECGFLVHGVDRSREMLTIAANRKRLLAHEIQERMTLSLGDIRDVRLNQHFDAVVSLFHVINYLTETSDLLSAFETAAEHLRPGGVFIFDFWYGPAVLTLLPTTRVKRITDGRTRVTRISEPTLEDEHNRVVVSMEFLIEEAADHGARMASSFSEMHTMRYLFLPEIREYARSAGLSLVKASEWMSTNKIGSETWCGSVVLKKDHSVSIST